MSIALQTRGLKVALGGHEVLHGMDLDVTAGHWTCVVGPNGAGKSTLLKALAGLLPFQGQVLWQGRSLLEMERRERALALSWLGQGEAASLDLRVRDVVMLLAAMVILINFMVDLVTLWIDPRIRGGHRGA